MTKYSIDQFSQITGITKFVLRTWENRYGFLKAERTDTKIRFYTDELLVRALNSNYLLENGFKLIKEDYKLVDTTTTATTSQSIAPLAQNREFGLNADSIVDFSVSNPFGDISQNK